MKTRRNKSGPTQAFTFVEIMIVTLTILALAAFFLPAILNNRCVATRINCVNNLKQVGLSFRTWALDNADHNPMQVSVTNGGTMELVGTGRVFPHFQVMSNELSTPKILACPQDRSTDGKVATTFASVLQGTVAGVVPFTNDNQVSYFVGVDATETAPTMLLTGDRNLGVGVVPFKGGLHGVWTNAPVEWVKPRHGAGGNMGLADGSVEQVLTPRLREFLARSGVATNRLAMP
jgi:prepilin-type processing-associated H-X9-DG protein